jgi:hypothetical protein
VTYEIWLEEVKDALHSINMPMEDWQGVWPFDFSGEHDAGATPGEAAMKANRYWWREQNKSLKQDCQKVPGCWLPRAHQAECQPQYEPGDHIKVEFEGEGGMPGEWMWVIVQKRDDKKRIVFGMLDNEPLNEYDGKAKLGSHLAISYDRVREHRNATDLTNSPPYSGTNETHMNAEQMKSLKTGDILVYDDGRAGHRDVKAVVLSNDKNSLIVQFEDRADTTTIKHDDVGWTKYLRRE